MHRIMLSVVFPIILCGTVAWDLKGDSREERIIGGKPARIWDHKYMVAFVIYKAYAKFRQHDHCYCGGTIIRPFWVLTAGYCITYWQNQELDVVKHIKQGAVAVRSNSSFCYNGRKSIDRKMIFRLWYPKKRYNIGLVKVDKPFDGLYEKCVTLPQRSYFKFQDFDYGHTVGWGATNGSNKIPSQRLNHVDIPMYSRAACIHLFHYDPLLIQKFEICAGDQKDTCVGDAGGPLFMHKRIVTQIGIVSWDHECSSFYPGLYVLVAPFIKWINRTMEQFDAQTGHELCWPIVDE